MNPHFKYGPLTPGYIRLVHLHRLDPLEDIQQLRGEILVTSLNQAPPYKALSYVWGAAATKDALQCAQGWLSMTTNLSEALHHLASSSDQVLWIDQICINQSDLRERSQQVDLMGFIFRGAQQVIMWLGSDSQGYASTAVVFIQEILLRSDRKFKEGTYPSNQNLLRDNLPETSSEKWAALRHLFLAPYFERVWILQEVMLASSKTIHWGSQEIAWMDFVGLTSWLAGSPDLTGYGEPINYDSLVRAHQLTQETRDLSYLLRLVSRKKATDERDKVYGLLGLIDSAEEPLRADYSKSVQEVFRDAARYLILQKGIFHVVSLVEHVPAGKSLVDQNALSWVPDWRDRFCRALIQDSGTRGYAASADIRLEHPIFAADDLNTIMLQGVESSKVKHLSLLSVELARANGLVQLDQIWDAWKMIQNDLSAAQPSDHPPIRALIWTFICSSTAVSKKTDPTQWDNSIYLHFASAWAATLLRPHNKSTEDPFHSVQNYLDLSATAILTYKGFFVSAASERRKLIANLVSKELAEISANMDSPELKQRYEERVGVIRESLSRYEPDTVLVETCVEMVVYCYKMAGAYNAFMAKLLILPPSRRFFITADGHMGLGPSIMEKDDVVAVLFGSPVPYVLRPRGGRWLFIGDCYMRGIMEGKAIERFRCEGELEARMKAFKIR